MNQDMIQNAILFISQNQTAKIIIAIIFITLISYLAFANGENLGRFIYIAIH